MLIAIPITTMSLCRFSIKNKMFPTNKDKTHWLDGLESVLLGLDKEDSIKQTIYWVPLIKYAETS